MAYNLSDRAEPLSPGSSQASQDAPKRLRVLVLAEAANPSFVSVPLVGWSHAEALSRVADIHLVTQVRNREAILAAGWREGEDFTAIDSERVARPAWRLGERLPGGWTTRMAVTAVAYRYFEACVWAQFRDSLEAGKWDIVHRLTPLSPTVPSPMAVNLQKIGVPFVLGPLNGGVAWPRGFSHARHAEREWLSYLRDAYKLIPGYRGTRRAASAIICGSKATLEQMPVWCRHKCHYLPENGIDPTRFSRQVERPPTLPLRAVFTGRLVPYKGPDVLIEAAAPLLRAGVLELDVLGDGPMMPKLKDLLHELDVSQRVRLHGWIPHEQLESYMLEADVFAFPSVREFGGGAVLEAMALGLAPIVADYAGPAELVTEDTGIKIGASSREALVANMQEALQRLVADPALARELGARARQRVLDGFTWDRKAVQVLDIYRYALQPTSP